MGDNSRPRAQHPPAWPPPGARHDGAAAVHGEGGRADPPRDARNRPRPRPSVRRGRV